MPKRPAGPIFVTYSSKTKRKDKGTLMASGFVAGGAIMGVLAAIARFTGISLSGDQGWSVDHELGLTHWATENPWSAVVTLTVFCLIGYYLYRGARRAGDD